MSGTWHEDAESKANASEQRVKFAALDSFARYQRTAHYNVTHRRRQNFYAMPQEHWQLLSKPPFNILEKFNRVDDAIDTNSRIAKEIVRHSFDAFGVDEAADEWKDTAKAPDIEKARSTIRQFYRDWSSEGRVERSKCFDPVLEKLTKAFANEEDRDQVKVLVPGAGLGRLVIEICALGFEVEGNELSFHQLMASNWILNGTKAGQEFQLFPWAYSFSNQDCQSNAMQSVQIPDIHPGTYLNDHSQGRPRHAFERLGMSAADFCSLYAQDDQKDQFDVVATVYFIDTAPNLIRYVEAIRNSLKVGGRWINHGPLLWHFEDRGPKEKDSANADSMTEDAQGIDEAGNVELTLEEVLALVKHMGFERITGGLVDQSEGYIQDPTSMMMTSYKCLQFEAIKVC